MDGTRHTVVEAIATGHPSVAGTQAEAAAFMQQVTSLPERIRQRLPLIYERSAIDTRHTSIADYKAQESDAFTFFPPNWALKPAPTTQTRNQRYKEVATPLAADVARRALEKAGCSADDITHVIAVSCTGFYAPGIDVSLIQQLGLAPTTQRTAIGFMGCYAAFNALRVAHSFCQANPDACVLLVCVELCTLHFQIDDTLESAIVNALFSDGAAAAILRSLPDSEARGRMAYVGGHTVIAPDSEGDMTWDIGDTGFLMGLSPRVPGVIADYVTGYVDTLLARHSMSRPDIDFWAIHPGGRAIVDRAREALDLSEADVAVSLDVLREHGNMSSPTILFILERLLFQHQEARKSAGNGAGAGDAPEKEEAGSGVAMAFGPGLTLEGCLFARVS